jgi:hypothetical protein
LSQKPVEQRPVCSSMFDSLRFKNLEIFVTKICKKGLFDPPRKMMGEKWKKYKKENPTLSSPKEIMLYNYLLKTVLDNTFVDTSGVQDYLKFWVS